MSNIKQAVILAGGQGIRMHPLTLTTPKPMIPIHGKPFLAYLIELLKKNGISEVILLVGYLHKTIEEYFGDGKKFGLSIHYSFSSVEADTGTRIKNALQLLDNNFLLLYGDNYWPLRLTDLTDFYEKMNTKASVVVYSNLDSITKNNIFVDGHGLIQIYDRSRTKENLNGVDIGFFILDKSIFINLPEENFSFEDVILPRLVTERQLAGFLTHHKYYGLSNPGRIPAIEKYLSPKKLFRR